MSSVSLIFWTSAQASLLLTMLCWKRFTSLRATCSQTGTQYWNMSDILVQSLFTSRCLYCYNPCLTAFQPVTFKQLCTVSEALVGQQLHGVNAKQCQAVSPWRLCPLISVKLCVHSNKFPVGQLSRQSASMSPTCTSLHEKKNKKRQKNFTRQLLHLVMLSMEF